MPKCISKCCKYISSSQIGLPGSVTLSNNFNNVISDPMSTIYGEQPLFTIFCEIFKNENQLRYFPWAVAARTEVYIYSQRY